MTRRRWIADESSDDRAALIGAHADHLARVLRARVGQEFDVSTSGIVRRGKISSIEKGRVEFELGEPVVSSSLPPITLALSIFKFDRMEWAIEKCVELGAARIVPVIAQRTEKHLALTAVKRVERWRRLAQQASEQSRRSLPPAIAAPVRVEDALLLPGSTRIVLSEAEREVMLRDLILPGNETVLASGPEGGWTEAELERFHASGWQAASLGETVLRAETAAIAALAVAVSQI